MTRDTPWLLLALACAGVIVCYPMHDVDVYWHLANGRVMLEQGRIVNEEVLSWTRAGVPFVNHEWLTQVLWFAVYRAFGGVGLNVVKIVLALGAAGFVFRACRMQDAEPPLAALLTVAAIFVGINRYTVRPDVFSLLFTAVLVYTLFGYGKGALSKRALYPLPLLMVAWDWLHGAVYGLALLLAYTSAENAKFLLRARVRSALDGAALRALNRWVALTLIAMALNPYGLRTYGIFFEFLGDNPLVQRVGEFMPPTWEWNAQFFVMLGVVAAALVFAWRRVNLAHIAVLIPFAVLALRYERVTAVFALVAAPLLAAWWPRAQPRLRSITLAGVAALLLTHAGYVKLIGNTQLRIDIREIDDGFPVGSARFIRALNVRGEMYNPGAFGGYLAFALGPERKIFQYNHHTVFGDTLRFMERPELLAPFDISYAIVAYAEEIERLFPPAQWAPVYHETGVSLLLKRTPANADLVARYETTHYLPHRFSNDELRKLADYPQALPRLLRELADHLAFRRDAAASALLVELLKNERVLTPEQRAAIIADALRFNADDAALAALAPGMRR